jgi:hypothetical protein
MRIGEVTERRARQRIGGPEQEVKKFLGLWLHLSYACLTSIKPDTQPFVASATKYLSMG